MDGWEWMFSDMIVILFDRVFCAFPELSGRPRDAFSERSVVERPFVFQSIRA